MRNSISGVDADFSIAAKLGAQLKRKTRIGGLGTFIILSLGLLCVTGCSRENTSASPGALVNISAVLDSAVVQAGPGVQVSVVKRENDHALQMTCDDQTPVPMVVFKEGTGRWRLSNYRYVAFDVTNRSEHALFVEGRLAGNGWYSGGQNVAPGKTRTIRIYVQRINEYPSYLDKKFIGMDALPGGIIKAFWWTAMHPDSMHEISVLLINPSSANKIEIANIRGEGAIDPPPEAELNDQYYPIVDEFGQLRHGEWPGKIHSMEEMLKAKEAEAADLHANPPPAEWDQYGGWLQGPQLKATGHFRTEKVHGKWWFVDPAGRLFWSHGIDEVAFGNATPISDREHYFAKLPDSTQYKSFYETRHGRIPKGYYKGERTIRSFDHFAWNLSRKYGAQWQQAVAELAHQRIKSWGMNTIGAWSDTRIIRASKMPYTETLGTDEARRIEGSEGPWGKFPDPFDPSLKGSLMAGLKRVKESESDPYLIGYFVDNEFHWGNNSYLAKAVIRSGKNQPAKLAMRDFLKKKYDTIDQLNAQWHTSYKSWGEFMESTTLPLPEPPPVFGSSTVSAGNHEAEMKFNELKGYAEDTRAFTAMVANTYYGVIKESLARIAPGCLYMGSKFDFVYYPRADTSGSWIVKIAAKHVDVIPFDRYSYTNEDFIPIDADKPFIIGEWGMGALDHGMLHYGLRMADSQDNRAEMYDVFVRSSVQNPYIVGTLWFTYRDEPVLGREDGEDYNMGFLDVCDSPYPEMVAAARGIGRTMFEERFGK